MSLSGPVRRAPLILPAILALLFGLWAGLIRLGWPWPLALPTLPMNHGPLMVGGFLGVLISLERAVALGKPWAYLAPGLTGLGALLALAGFPVATVALLITGGSLVLALVVVQIVRIQSTLFSWTIAAGSISWWAGNTLWLFGGSIPAVVLWWAAFPILTIAGERLELSRMLKLSPQAYTGFAIAILALAAGALVSTIAYSAGVRLAGVGMALLAIWLWRYDIAWRRLRAGGQARYIAVCLLSGYGWLAFSGLLALLYGGVMAGPRYDAILHSVFLGFVFPMIFGHALIIFPVVFGLPVAYSPRLYSHLLLLHLSLLLRIAGDLIPWWPARLWGGLFNVVVLLLFMANTVASLRRSQPAQAATAAPVRASR
jgi:hypothetical protein